MSAAASEPAGETADATGGAAGETGVEGGGGGGGVYICDIMCVWACVCVRLLGTQLGRLTADKHEKKKRTFRYCSRASSSALRIESL